MSCTCAVFDSRTGYGVCPAGWIHKNSRLTPTCRGQKTMIQESVWHNSTCDHIIQSYAPVPTQRHVHLVSCFRPQKLERMFCCKNSSMVVSFRLEGPLMLPPDFGLYVAHLDSRKGMVAGFYQPTSEHVEDHVVGAPSGSPGQSNIC